MSAPAPILARYVAAPAPALAAAPEWIMWMPAGLHTIHCSQGAKKVKVQVNVTAETARVAQSQLEAYLAAGKQRPYFDFAHDEKNASAWPLEFAWREDGVWARVEWSGPGREAVMGKTYRAFSPSFYTDSKSPSQVTRLAFCMGGLVNDPAFREIEPLWAADARGELNKTDMDPKDAELAAANARLAQLEQEIAELKAATAADDTGAKLNAKEAELAETQRKLDAANNEVKSRAKRDAEACVKAAVARGAIPPQDTVLQARWAGMIEQDPKNADLLNALKGAPALQASRLTRPQVEIITSDTNDVLRAYHACRNPRDRGAMYRKELDPILAKGDPIDFDRLRRVAPFQAENTLGTLVGNIISQRTLATLVSMRPMLRDVVTDFSDTQARLNQTVYTRAVGLPTIQNFGSAGTDAAVTDYPVQLSAHKQALFSFTATEQNSTGRNLVGEHSQALAVAIGNHLVDAVAALITDAFTSETTGAAANKDFSAITTACKTLNTAGAPDIDRFGWINADFAEALSNDEVMADYSEKAGTSAYSRWLNVKGFKSISEYPALPANSVNLIGFTFQRNALLLATRLALNPSEIIGAGYPGTLEVVTDPVSGLSVMNNMWVDASTLAVNARIILLYGCARGLIGAGHKFVTS